MTTAELTNTLNGLIETARDGQQGYENAAQDIDNDVLKPTLRELAAQREAFVNELTTLIDDLGGTVDSTDGSILAAMHRAWMDVKTAISNNESEAVLEACIRGDEAALENYRQALAQSMPDNVNQTVTRHYEAIKNTLDKLQSMQTTA